MSQKVDIDNPLDISKDSNLKKIYLKEVFIRKLKEKFIVEPSEEGCDFCIYIENNNSSFRYKKFTRLILFLKMFTKMLKITPKIFVKYQSALGVRIPIS